MTSKTEKDLSDYIDKINAENKAEEDRKKTEEEDRKVLEEIDRRQRKWEDNKSNLLINRERLAEMKAKKAAYEKAVAERAENTEQSKMW
jgi:hypothetical protein